MSDDAALRFGLPSKGRLQEQASEFFAAAGLRIRKSGGRGYTGRLDGAPGVEIVFLQAAEIPGSLESGAVHIGVTGEDLLREKARDFDARIALVQALGFGRADLVVAAPTAWIDVATMADLDDVSHDLLAARGRRLRVATKYLNLTRAHFRKHGLIDYEIVESLGATEGAPASGAADVVVDITSTGATLAANDLKILDDGLMLASEAQLAASLMAPWGASALKALERILDLIAARARGGEMEILRFAGARRAIDRAAADLEALGCRIAAGDEDLEPRVIAPAGALYDVVVALRRAGASAISATRADYIFDTENPAYDAFTARLRGR